MDHTRSLRRRFLATVVDAILVAILFGLLTYPLANSLDSPFRSGMGLVYWQSCGQGEAFLQDGRPAKKGEWQQVQICDRVLDGVFPYRSAIFFTTTKTESNGITTTFSKYVTFELDGKNRLTFPFSLSSLGWLLFLSLAVFLEAKRGQTPGKWLMGIAVRGKGDSLPTITQALKRNILKNFPIFAIAILSAGSTFYTNTWLKSLVTSDGTIATLNADMGTVFAMLVVSALLSLVQLIMWLSVLFPWSKAGRGLYDRWAGTRVISE